MNAPALPVPERDTPVPEGDTRNLPLLRIGASIQLLGAIPGVLILLSYFWNASVSWRVYRHVTADLPEAGFWVVPLVALALAPFVWARRRWAWWASLLLTPGYALSPWLHWAWVRGVRPDYAPFLLYAGGLGVLSAVVIGTLYRKGRDALLPPAS